MYCRFCGEEIADDSVYCKYCGKITQELDKDTVKQKETKAKKLINEQVTIYQKDSQKAEQDEKKVRENLFQYIERFGKKIGKKLIDSLKFLFSAMTDPRTPLQVKLIAIAALVYFISPIDLIPDFIPGLGLVDDAAAIAVAVASISSILVQHGIHLGEDKKQTEK